MDGLNKYFNKKKIAQRYYVDKWQLVIRLFITCKNMVNSWRCYTLIKGWKCIC